MNWEDRYYDGTDVALLLDAYRNCLIEGRRGVSDGWTTRQEESSWLERVDRLVESSGLKTQP